jgi:hypothetical protein
MTRSNEPRVEFSYAIFWTKQALAWPASRRAAVLAAVQDLMRRPDFELNDYHRRYTLPGLDSNAHAGRSLAALEKVLIALQSES